jgi:hypothetical protein
MAIEINYGVRLGSEFSGAAIERMATAAGRSPFSVGKAKGYVSNTGGVLFVPCPSGDDPRSLVRIEAYYLHHPDDVQGAWRKHFRDLTVSTARYVAQDALKCEGAENLGRDGSE